MGMPLRGEERGGKGKEGKRRGNGRGKVSQKPREDERDREIEMKKRVSLNSVPLHPSVSP
jgi:hypothetical protein